MSHNNVHVNVHLLTELVSARDAVNYELSSDYHTMYVIITPRTIVRDIFACTVHFIVCMYDVNILQVFIMSMYITLLYTTCILYIFLCTVNNFLS